MYNRSFHSGLCNNRTIPLVSSILSGNTENSCQTSGCSSVYFINPKSKRGEGPMLLKKRQEGKSIGNKNLNINTIEPPSSTDQSHREFLQRLQIPNLLRLGTFVFRVDRWSSKYLLDLYSLCIGLVVQQSP